MDSHIVYAQYSSGDNKIVEYLSDKVCVFMSSLVIMLEIKFFPNFGWSVPFIAKLLLICYHQSTGSPEIILTSHSLPRCIVVHYQDAQSAICRNRFCFFKNNLVQTLPTCKLMLTVKHFCSLLLMLVQQACPIDTIYSNTIFSGFRIRERL